MRSPEEQDVVPPTDKAGTSKTVTMPQTQKPPPGRKQSVGSVIWGGPMSDPETATPL